MDVPSWIIAGCSLATLIGGAFVSVRKLIKKIREDRQKQHEHVQKVLHAQAEEALKLAREEARDERKAAGEATLKYQESLEARIRELQAELDNEERARETLQRRYEELLMLRKDGS